MANIADRVKKHRKNLHKNKKGLRLVQIWVPDTQRKGFAKECRRQSRLVRKDRHEAEILRWMDEVAYRDGWAP